MWRRVDIMLTDGPTKRRLLQYLHPKRQLSSQSPPSKPQILQLFYLRVFVFETPQNFRQYSSSLISVQILCFWTLPIALFLSKTPSYFY
jgi:hypothetical protein